MTLTFQAHSDGKVIFPDQPREIPTNVPLRVTVEPIEQATKLQEAKGTSAPRRFQPLDIQIDSQLFNAIALDPAFDIEET